MAIIADSEPARPTGGPMRLPDMPLHDPFVVADEATRTYHLYTSNDPSVSGVEGVGTMVYRSDDLRDWTRPAVVFLAAEQDNLWAGDGGWAPEVHAWQGRFHLFTTLHDENSPLPVPPTGRWGTPFQLANHRRGTITAVSDSLLGPFTSVDPARPTPPERLMTLDGTLYVDPSGQPWMVYAHEWLQTVDGDPGRCSAPTPAVRHGRTAAESRPGRFPPHAVVDVREERARRGRHPHRWLRADLRRLQVRRPAGALPATA